MTTPTPYDALRGSRLAAELSDEQCRMLATLMTERELADGEVLVPEGRSDAHLYLLVSGALDVTRAAGTPQAETLFALNPGEPVGELSFLDDNLHYASVVSRGASRVLVLGRAQLESLLDSAPHAVYGLMLAIVRRVHQAQHRLAAQSAELTNYIYKQHGRY